MTSGGWFISVIYPPKRSDQKDKVCLTAFDSQVFGSAVSLVLLRLIGFTDVAADHPAYAAWAAWSAPAQRGWFARVLRQALGEHLGDE